MTKRGKGRRAMWSNRFSCVARRRGRDTKDSRSDRTIDRRIGFGQKKVESLVDGARDCSLVLRREVSRAKCSYWRYLSIAIVFPLIAGTW